MKTEINVTKIIIVEEEYREKLIIWNSATDYLKPWSVLQVYCSEREVDLKK